MSTQTTDQQWIKILDKGMVTIPKEWRDEWNLTKGSLVKAVKTGNQLVIEPQAPTAPYRVYSKAELDEMRTDDTLSPQLKSALEKKFG